MSLQPEACAVFRDENVSANSEESKGKCAFRGLSE